MLKREYYLKQIRGFYNSKDLVKIIYGIRRSGKSVILEQIIEELKKDGVDEEHIIFINFEEIENIELRDYLKFNDYVKSKVKDKKTYYLFVDEVQYLDKFEMVINSLRVKNNFSIFITGSNSSVTFKEVSSLLSGRYVSFKITPLSYFEYLEITKKKKSFDSFKEYINYGGLPEVYSFDNNGKIRYLNDVLNSIILKDVVEKYNVRDISLFNLILNYLIDTNGREISINNISNYLKSIKRNAGNDTIYKYISYLYNCFIFSEVKKYDVHGKNILKNSSKCYLTDLGLGNIRRSNNDSYFYICMETTIYNELIRRNYEVYYSNDSSSEVDFIAKKDDEIIYIQVCKDLSDDETRTRELKSLNLIKDNYKKVILTLDDNSYNTDGIVIINLLDFLCNKEL